MRAQGRYVHDAIPVVEIWPASGADDAVRKAVGDSFALGRTRTTQQDVEFAINQLVEVAVRALSPGVNDPFTAITCTDRLVTAILHLMRREFPSRFRVDEEGTLRSITDQPDFADLCDSAFHQIRQSRAKLPAVMIHLLDSLNLLLREARTLEHRCALERHIDLVRCAGIREADEPSDRDDIRER